jgi:ectoine hydroxylase-related dioxygenase (phytanoyl-CoA dioxygenase family)
VSTVSASPPSVLSRKQIDQYHEDGYLVLRQLFSPFEIAALLMEAERLLERRDLIHTDNIRCRWQPHVVTDECLFETFDPVIDLAPLCGRLALDSRILNVLADLYGEPAHLFKDKLIFKPPGAKGYDLHQDFISWKDFPRSFITVLVPIDPADRVNGCTEVFPGYHQRGYLSPEDGDYHPVPEGVVDETRAIPLELAPGDIALFGAFTPHRSAPNRSDGWRRQLYLSYNAASDGGDRRTAHYREFHDWLKVKYAEYGKHHVYFQ